MIEMSTNLPRSAFSDAGRLNMIMRRYLAETERAVADYGLQLINFYMQSYFKHETPFYRTRVHVEYTGDPRITDGGVIYGPWLAGEGSRNATTRFKGYAHWRRTRQSVELAAPDIADQTWNRVAGGQF